MTSIYHGGAKIEKEIKSPIFLYETLSDSVYFALSYSGIENNQHVSEFALNKKAKILDLVDGNIENNEKFIDELMKKCGMVFEKEYNQVNNSYNEVGREVFGYDIDLALFPKFREEMLKAGFNVLKTHTVMENTCPTGYAVLDPNVLYFKKEYKINHDDESVLITITKDSALELNSLGKSYRGEMGYGDINFTEVITPKKSKKM